MTHKQKVELITNWLIKKFNVVNTSDFIDIGLFSSIFVGTHVASLDDVRNLYEYSILPFKMDDEVILQLINHPCKPVTVAEGLGLPPTPKPNLSDVIERLQNVQRWEGYTGDYYGPSIDWDKEEDGDWVKYEDIENIIKELKQLL